VYAHTFFLMNVTKLTAADYVKLAEAVTLLTDSDPANDGAASPVLEEWIMKIGGSVGAVLMVLFMLFRAWKRMRKTEEDGSTSFRFGVASSCCSTQVTTPGGTIHTRGLAHKLSQTFKSKKLGKGVVTTSSPDLRVDVPPKASPPAAPSSASRAKSRRAKDAPELESKSCGEPSPMLRVKKSVTNLQELI
jgi:hypothetical protein